MKNLTKLEEEFLNCFREDAQEVNNIVGDEIYVDLTKDLIIYASEKMSITKNQVKGIIGDLVKKDIILIDEVNGESALDFYERSLKE